MLIIPPAKLHLDKWLDLSFKAALFILIAGIATALFFSFFPFSKGEMLLSQERVLSTKAKSSFFYESIGSGGLALRPRHALGWVSRLASELSLIAYNSRPDVDPQEAKIIISLKNSAEQLALVNGSSLFLKEKEQGKGLLSSEKPTHLWIKPILLENGAVLIDTARKLVSKEGNEGEEKGQFILASQGSLPPHYNPHCQNFAKELKSARSFSADLLMQNYGGKEYASFKEKCVLQFNTGANTYACFVSSGDYLLYEQGEWRVFPYENLKKECPLAHVRSITARSLEIEAWDEMGFYPLHFKLEMQPQDRLQHKPDSLPTKVRLRNASQVSCLLGKRRVILKQGDWVLKTPTGWHNLRRAEEIQSYLNHRLKGELFIFDTIEKEQGHFVMKGHLFDETRTQIMPLAFPIDSEKSQGKTSRKRKPFYSSLRTS